MRFNIFKTFPFLEVYNEVKDKNPSKCWLQFLDLLRYKEIIYSEVSSFNWLGFIDFNFTVPISRFCDQEEIVLDETIEKSLETFNEAIENIVRNTWIAGKEYFRIEIIYIEKIFPFAYTFYYNIKLQNEI